MHDEPSVSDEADDDRRPPPRGSDAITLEPLAAVGALPVGVLLPVVLIAALLVALGAASLTRDLPTLVRFAVSQPCPSGAPAPDCVAHLTGTITSRRDTARRIDSTQSRDITLLYADVPDLPDGVRTFRGQVVLTMAPPQADRIDGRRGTDVEVSFFAGIPVTVTGPNGVTVRVEDDPVVRFAGMVALTLALAGLTLLGAVPLQRRLRARGTATADPRASPLAHPRWAVAVAIGLVAAGVAGGALGWAAGRLVGPAWSVPTALAAAGIAGCLTAIRGWRSLPS